MGKKSEKIPALAQIIKGIDLDTPQGVRTAAKLATKAYYDGKVPVAVSVDAKTITEKYAKFLKDGASIEKRIRDSADSMTSLAGVFRDEIRKAIRASAFSRESLPDNLGSGSSDQSNKLSDSVYGCEAAITALFSSLAQMREREQKSGQAASIYQNYYTSIIALRSALKGDFTIRTTDDLGYANSQDLRSPFQRVALVVTTPDCILIKRGAKHNMGKYDIWFLPAYAGMYANKKAPGAKDMVIRVLATPGSVMSKSRTTYIHPHVTRNGSVCYGEAFPFFVEGTKSGNLLDMFQGMMQMLGQYHDNGQYDTYDAWSGAQSDCYECGRSDRLQLTCTVTYQKACKECGILDQHSGLFCCMSKSVLMPDGTRVHPNLTARLFDGSYVHSKESFVVMGLHTSRVCRESSKCCVSKLDGAFIGPLADVIKPEVKWMIDPFDVVMLEDGRRVSLMCLPFVDKIRRNPDGTQEEIKGEGAGTDYLTDAVRASLKARTVYPHYELSAFLGDFSGERSDNRGRVRFEYNPGGRLPIGKLIFYTGPEGSEKRSEVRLA
ncbi:MAG: hypothetical protein AB7V18_19615 [Pyrinomonadaceae bacterium]